MMNISDLLIIHVIAIMRIYSFGYVYLIRVTKSIHLMHQHDNVSIEISCIFQNNADGSAIDVQR